jgi:pimeloyl-ACP methyl ester carboxylesterase
MTQLPRRTRRVVSADVELHVVEVGEPGRPPLLLVHGFPDTHELFTPLLDDLGRDFHVTAFDLRGAGESSAPSSPAGYRIEAVLPDFTAVIDAVYGPSAKVHLVAHDWGSVLAFSYVSDPTFKTRVRTFTSVSGPHLGLFWSDNLRHLRSGELKTIRLGLGQIASSWYALFFALPVLPKLLFRKLGDRVYRQSLLRGGVSRHDPYTHASTDEVYSRVEHTLALYAQNALKPPPPPAPGSITVPLSLVIPLRDPFVRPQSFAFLHEYATNLRVHPIDASHWLPRSHPGELARIVRALAASVDDTPHDAQLRDGRADEDDLTVSERGLHE